ncbi:hypothetical protein J421_1536 [Gemmatirosa kalamazoonensis]|uniref:Outer membrane protein beta-barrel domain-containing protein n=1 Tax=Gemmatirosa kalamazoonensis TaxID=861299 RepID=W0RI36_9BACT|nr:hypothetical protein [Gemmatirosa kalamazoonensis]AHG89073.1 hypothetical protein J421_1536 [Gemmatirosa kalamazoonensis]
MSTRFRLAALTLVAAVPVARAAAQSPMRSPASERPLRLGIAGGVVIPRTGNTARALETGLHGQAFALLKLPGGLPALRLNVDYAHMQFAKPTTGTTGTTASSVGALDGARTLLDGVAGMRLNLLHGPVRPYVLAGVGAFNVRDALQASATSVATGGTTAAALDKTLTSTNFGVDGGAGIAFKLGPIDGFVETRLQNVYTRGKGFVDTKSIQSFPVAFGLTF